MPSRSTRNCLSILAIRYVTNASCRRQSESLDQSVLGSTPSRRTGLPLAAWSTFPALLFASRLCAALHKARGFAFAEGIADRSVALGHRDGAVARLFVDGLEK